MLGGEIEFILNGEARHVQAGGFVSVPDGAVHSFHAVGETPARILIVRRRMIWNRRPDFGLEGSGSVG